MSVINKDPSLISAIIHCPKCGMRGEAKIKYVKGCFTISCSACNESWMVSFFSLNQDGMNIDLKLSGIEDKKPNVRGELPKGTKPHINNSGVRLRRERPVKMR